MYLNIKKLQPKYLQKMYEVWQTTVMSLDSLNLGQNGTNMTDSNFDGSLNNSK